MMLVWRRVGGGGTHVRVRLLPLGGVAAHHGDGRGYVHANILYRVLL
jgi:hypothetical protein